MPAPRPESSLSTRSKTSTSQPRSRSISPARSPLIEPPITSARRLIRRPPRPFSSPHLPPCPTVNALPFAAKSVIHDVEHHWRNAMAMSMTDKAAARSEKTEWPKALQQEFEREAQNHNGCVGSEFVSESDRVRVWTIRLKPGQRFGFHRHVLDYFWTSVPGEYKVHDLENIGDKELVFMTVEFLNSANKPLPLPQAVRDAAAA